MFHKITFTELHIFSLFKLIFKQWLKLLRGLTSECQAGQGGALTLTIWLVTGIQLSVLIVTCRTHDKNNFIPWENMRIKIVPFFPVNFRIQFVASWVGGEEALRIALCSEAWPIWHKTSLNMSSQQRTNKQHYHTIETESYTNGDSFYVQFKV